MIRKALSVKSVVLLVALLCVSASAAPGQRPEVMFILDASGSMWGFAGRQSKIQIARDVLSKVVMGLPRGVKVGLTVYGHRRYGDCTDVQILIPAGSTNRVALLAKVREIRPRGKTPIAASIKLVAKAISRRDVKTSIVLISDGVETCHADPCGVVKALKKAGIRFVMHVVGFAVGKRAKAQLACMAKASGGLYFGAKDAPSLSKALKKVAKKVVVAKPAPRPAVKASLKVEKTEYKPGEAIRVHFVADPVWPRKTWVGLFPANVPHDDYNLNDRSYVSYQYLRQRSQGVLVFKAPKMPRRYDFRLLNPATRREVVASAPFTVVKPVVKKVKGQLKLEKTVFAPLEMIRVHFVGDPLWPKKTWVGLIPANIPHGDYAVNDRSALTYQYLQQRSKGVLVFKAPKMARSYDLRIFNPATKREEAFVTFTVVIGKPSLKLKKKVFKPGELIQVIFVADPNWPSNSWIGCVPSNIPHGDTQVNYNYRTGKVMYLSNRARGFFLFPAPKKPGRYDFRMNNTFSKNEVTHVTFEVK